LQAREELIGAAKEVTMPLMWLRGRLSYETRLDESYAMKTIGTLRLGLCHGSLARPAAKLGVAFEL
jgi:hypothetical protein